MYVLYITCTFMYSVCVLNISHNPFPFCSSHDGYMYVMCLSVSVYSIYDWLPPSGNEPTGPIPIEAVNVGYSAIAMASSPAQQERPVALSLVQEGIGENSNDGSFVGPVTPQRLPDQAPENTIGGLMKRLLYTVYVLCFAVDLVSRISRVDSHSRN